MAETATMPAVTFEMELVAVPGGGEAATVALASGVAADRQFGEHLVEALAALAFDPGQRAGFHPCAADHAGAVAGVEATDYRRAGRGPRTAAWAWGFFRPPRRAATGPRTVACPWVFRARRSRLRRGRCGRGCGRAVHRGRGAHEPARAGSARRIR